MAKNIRRFQTISKHEASLRQSPAVIEGLVAVLEYIKFVLGDDATKDLYDKILAHITHMGITAHYFNRDLLTDQIIAAIRDAFIRLGMYSGGSSIFSEMLVTFWRDIYDGTNNETGFDALSIPNPYEAETFIPSDNRRFLAWLVSNPEIYTESIPKDYDAVRHGLTLHLLQDWLSTEHDLRFDVHENSLQIRLKRMFTACNSIVLFRLLPNCFGTLPFVLINAESYIKVMAIVEQHLLAEGSPLTIDFVTYPDIVLLPHNAGVTKLAMDLDTFFSDVYSQELFNGADLIQLNTDSSDTLIIGGPIAYANYDEFLADYGETDGYVYRKKFLNYYAEQLSFVVDDNLPVAYNDFIKATRMHTNRNYSKVFNVFSVINKTGFGIDIRGNINHLAVDRTLDLINIVGLSKSIVCLCLVPYYDAGYNLMNKLVVSFDNYNPDFTMVLMDNIVEGQVVTFNVAISVSKDTFTVYNAIDLNYMVQHFDATDRIYYDDPFFLFVSPRVDVYQAGTTRLTDVKLYGQALTDDDSMSLVAGFRQY